MQLVPWTSKGETPKVWHSPSRLFDEFFNDRFFNNYVQNNHHWRPAVDILEKDDDLILRAEVPGMSEKDIELKLEGNVLTLKGTRKLEDEQDRNNYHQLESFYGSFTRSFTLPETVDRDKIKADYKNGVLTIRIPQKPEVKPRSIPVKTG